MLVCRAICYHVAETMFVKTVITNLEAPCHIREILQPQTITTRSMAAEVMPLLEGHHLCQRCVVKQAISAPVWTQQLPPELRDVYRACHHVTTGPTLQVHPVQSKIQVTTWVS